jgi:hypothetical protein
MMVPLFDQDNMGSHYVNIDGYDIRRSSRVASMVASKMVSRANSGTPTGIHTPRLNLMYL